MAKTEWGIKRTCLSCGARFYDLKRDPITCPKCETVFDPLASLRPRRTRAAPVEAAPKPAAPAPAKEAAEEEEIDEAALAEGDDIADIEDDDDEDVIEDASELGEDDDDVGDVAVEGDEEER